ACAEAMRRILVEQARRRHSEKRGGERQRVALEGLTVAAPDGRPIDDLLALDDALGRLEPEDPPKAQLCKLRYFAGLPLEDCAQALGISVATAKRYWVYARSWLFGKLHGTDSDAPD